MTKHLPGAAWRTVRARVARACENCTATVERGEGYWRFSYGPNTVPRSQCDGQIHRCKACGPGGVVEPVESQTEL